MDPLSAVMSAIGLLQAVSATYTSISEIIDRPKAFDVVSKHLPLVQKILSTTKERLEARALGSTDASESAAIGGLLQDCNDKAKELKRIFDAIQAKRQSDQAATSWSRARAWYRTALKGIKAHRVETLMDEILKTTQQLAHHEILQLASREDISEIKEAIQELADVGPSLDDSEFDTATINASQTVETGAYGQQNNVTGGTNTLVSGKYNITGESATINFVVSDHDYLRGLFSQRQPHPPNEKARIERQKGGLVSESYKWVLENATFKTWLDADSGLLHVRGDPGKGKTMLLCGIINHLQRLAKTKKQPDNVIYFFCHAGDAQSDNAASVLRGFLRIIFLQQRALWTKYNEEMAEELSPLDVSSWDALEDIFMQVVQDPGCGSMYLVLDALDECDHDRDELLRMITRLPPGRVKTVVSSRNWDHIERSLGAVAHFEVSLEANTAEVSAAVTTYIERRVEQLARDKGYDPALRRQVEETLRAKSTGTFLWVSIVCEALSQPDVKAWTTMDCLNAFPPRMKPLYQRIIQQITISGSAGLARMLLALVLVVKRPVTLAELGSLIEWPSSFPGDRQSMEEALGLCRCLLNAREGEIKLVHHSARNFLNEDEEAHRFVFPAGIEHEHAVVARRSLGSMAAFLRRNVYNLHAIWVPVGEIEKPDSAPLDPVHYASVYWTYHLAQAPPRDRGRLLSDDGLVYQFARQHLLHWLEALSLLNETWIAIPSMSELDVLTPVQTSLKELVHDAWRFVKQHSDAIKLGPSQIYTSALLFSPAASIIRRINRAYEPDWARACAPAAGDSWSACLQSLEGHTDSVGSIAFSPDGQHLASASKDTTIRMWDVATGQCLLVLWPGSAVSSVVFTPDGKLLVSGDTSGAVRFWDRTSGQCLGVCNGHSETVNVVACFPGGDCVASGSDDGTVRLWDMASKASSGAIVVNTPDKELKHRRVRHVTISADGKKLEAENEAMTAVFEVSSSGAWLHRETVQKNSTSFLDILWPSCARPVPAHRGNRRPSWNDEYWWEPHTFTFSAAGDHALVADEHFVFSYALSSSTNEWEKSEWVGEHNGAHVSCVALSPTLELFASSDEGGLVRIWDRAITEGRSRPQLDQGSEVHEYVHPGFYSEDPGVVLSPDGAAIAIFDRWKNNGLWHVSSTGGFCRRTIDAKWPAAFSPDSRLLAAPWQRPQYYNLGPWRNWLPDGIGLWDTATRERVKILSYMTAQSKVLAVVFSPDGKYLAARLLLFEMFGFRTRAVHVWETETGNCREVSIRTTVASSESTNDVEASWKLEWEERWALSAPQQPENALLPPAGPLPDAPTAALHSATPRLSIDESGAWVELDGKRLLWLPPEWRSEAVAAHNKTLVLCAGRPARFVWLRVPAAAL